MISPIHLLAPLFGISVVTAAPVEGPEPMAVVFSVNIAKSLVVGFAGDLPPTLSGSITIPVLS